MERIVRVAAVGDLHCTRTSRGAFEPLFAEASTRADVLLLCGDLTDYGLPEEATVLAGELAAARIPVLAVLGNHDFESNRHEEVLRILREARVQVLDGDAAEVLGVGFAGTKGFIGGFGERALAPWGEETIKLVVREAVNEALKLESALARLRVPQRIVLLHYSPIQATVEGEPPVIFPFLGSSRLEEPLTRFSVRAVFHGHAHRGRFEGQTSNSVPVFNVCYPLLRNIFPDRPAFHVVEVPAEAGTQESR